MTKLDICQETADMLIPLEDMAAGASHMRTMYGKNQTWDIESLRYWRNFITSVAISRFEWYGLPAGIDARAFEFILNRYGQAALFMDEGGYLAAQFSNASNINMYYNPNRVLLTSPAGGMWTRYAQAWLDDDGELNTPNCVLCYESLSRYPVPAMIEYYARRLAKIDRIIDINMSAQRTPYIIRSSEQLHGTSKEVIRKLESNDQYIEFNSAGYDPNNIEVLQTNAPYIAKDMLEDQTLILNRALSALGIDSDPQSGKRERKVTLEVLQNNQQVSLARENSLRAREAFCKRARDVFGLEIDVKWSVRHMSDNQDMTKSEALRGQDTDGDYFDYN